MRKYPGIFVDMDLARSWKLAMSDTRGSPRLVTFQQCLHFCRIVDNHPKCQHCLYGDGPGSTPEKRKFCAGCTTTIRFEKE